MSCWHCPNRARRLGAGSLRVMVSGRREVGSACVASKCVTTGALHDAFRNCQIHAVPWGERAQVVPELAA